MSSQAVSSLVYRSPFGFRGVCDTPDGSSFESLPMSEPLDLTWCLPSRPVALAMYSPAFWFTTSLPRSWQSARYRSCHCGFFSIARNTSSMTSSDGGGASVRKISRTKVLTSGVRRDVAMFSKALPELDLFLHVNLSCPLGHHDLIRFWILFKSSALTPKERRGPSTFAPEGKQAPARRLCPG